jgi:uncharacterized membrane protein
MSPDERSAVAILPRTSSGEAEGFHTAMAHLYRGEMQRMTIWRSRLDTTSNWAILLTTGMTTFTLGSTAIPHYILLLCLALIGMCIVIEARRYRHMLHSKWRVYVLEANYFGRQVSPNEPVPDPRWREHLAADLKHPTLRTSLLMAFRLRLRRNYLMLVYFISGVWLTKVFLHPVGAKTVWEFHGRLAVGEMIASWFVAITAALFVVTCTVLALTSPSEEAMGDGPSA